MAPATVDAKGEGDKPPDSPSGGGGGGSGDLLSTLPGPVIRLLLIFALPITWLRTILEVLLWKNGKRIESWMVVVGWWALCLGGKHAFRYLLPPLLFAPLLPLSRLRLGTTKTPPPSTPSSPSTQAALLATLSDLHAIHALLPPSPLPSIQSLYSRFGQLGTPRLVRGLMVSWGTWIILGKYVTGYRALLALLGSIILLLPSPPLAHLIDTLSRSLAVRRAAALIFLFVFGSPPETSYRLTNVSDWSLRTWFSSKWATSRRPSLTWSFRPSIARTGPLSGSAIDDSPEQDSETTTGEPLYFRFEVHENQRWWMGLDWTSALLPQERPSWCDNHLLPVSPPPSFALPGDSSITLPAPTVAYPSGEVRRTAHWKWLDDDWSIVRVTPGAGGSTTTPLVPPTAILEGDEGEAGTGYKLGSSPPTNSAAVLGASPSKGIAEETFANATARAHTYAEAAFTKGLERLKARTGSPVGGAPKAGGRPSVDLGRKRTSSQASDDLLSIDEHIANASAAAGVPGQGVPETIVERDEATDADGWVYGDNKWEGMGPRGGLGKFTRRRRWQRRAVCTETITKLPGNGEPEVLSATTPKAAPVPPVVSTSTTNTDVAVDAHPEVAPLARHRSKDSAGSTREVITVIPDAPAESGRGHVASGSFSSSGMSRDDMLRQRLKKAMGNVGG